MTNLKKLSKTGGDKNSSGTQTRQNPYRVCLQAYLTMTQWQMCNQSYWNRPRPFGGSLGCAILTKVIRSVAKLGSFAI